MFQLVFTKGSVSPWLMRFSLPSLFAFFRLPPPRALATATLSELKARAHNSLGRTQERRPEEAKRFHACRNCRCRERDETMSLETRAWKRDLLAFCTSCYQMNNPLHLIATFCLHRHLNLGVRRFGWTHHTASGAPYSL